ncbi:MAG: endolytic transglycosylase MltG [Cryomorphaceae bacterium]|nr:endolytic transglycosylase MltG [Flavobacteriales bacterium]
MRKKRKSVKRGIVVFVVLLVLALAAGYHLYQNYFAPVVSAEMAKEPLYIPTGSSADDVLIILADRGLVKQAKITSKLMKRKNYAGAKVEPGMYRLREGMSINAVVNHLRGGLGEENVNITFNSARTLAELAGKASRNIEADSAMVAALITNPETARKYGFSGETFLSMFLPDTYYSEWDTDAEAFVQRMAREYKQFWNEERIEKARKIGLSQSEVSTLASIVQAEQQLRPEERPVIAGLYLNRLRRGMKLQSDPTVVFAVGDFNINRVLNVHLVHNSPYNTYKYSGLPPGPINVPQKSSIDAVLNPDKNNYLFMCAKADFTGYHAFATTLAEHNRNAAAYRKALNERKIYR